MNIDELFVEAYDLPDALEKDQILELFKMMNLGDDSAREIIARHNILLVLNEVTNKFKNVDYDKKELVAIGAVGLVNAINTFDVTKGIAFSTYAVHCIDNEIYMFLRNSRKYMNNISLDMEVCFDIDGNSLCIKDSLVDDMDIESDYEQKELYGVLNKIVDNLPLKDRELVKLYFGFYGRVYNQKEIASKMGISQAHVSRLITKIVVKIRKYMENNECISKRKKKIGEKGKNRTIYEFLKDFPKEKVDALIMSLSYENYCTLVKRYGYNLENPVFNSLDSVDSNKFYYLINRMRKKLAYDKARNLDSNSLYLEYGNVNGEVDVFTSKDYIKFKRLMKVELFTKLKENFTLTEAMIILLKYGYIDDKRFSNNVISSILGISDELVQDILNNVLKKLNGLDEVTRKLVIK